jgi:hypothetical protein
MAGSGKYRHWEQIEFALCFDEAYLERADGWTVIGYCKSRRSGRMTLSGL